MRSVVDWNPAGCGALLMPAGPSDLEGSRECFSRLASRARALDLGAESLFLAWELAQLARRSAAAAGRPGPDDDQERSLMLLVLFLLISLAEGGTRLPLFDSSRLERLGALLEVTENEQRSIRELIDVACTVTSGGSADSWLSSIVGGPGDYRPLLVDHRCLYVQRLHVLEARVAAAFGKRVYSSCKEPVEERDDLLEAALEEVLRSPPLLGGAHSKRREELDESQVGAVRAALSGRIAVVAGRPGSGKTSIVATMLRVLSRVGDPPLESMALAAPTGKASDRMRQSIARHLSLLPDPARADRRLQEACPPSSTLHRLLGYSPGQERYWHDEHNPLSERLVIVDESSMIDLPMMDRLLRALRPDGRIVLLGDADQLPPVEAGAVFRDLCESRVAKDEGRVVVLEKSHRAREDDTGGKAILDLAGAINEGSMPGFSEGGGGIVTRGRPAEIAFQGVEHVAPEGAAGRAEVFSIWLDRLKASLGDPKEKLTGAFIEGPSGFDEASRKRLQGLFLRYESSRVLSVTRMYAGGTGSDAVNEWFHRRWARDFGNVAASRGSPFLLGEPVLVTRNDHSLRLYNGDSGLVLPVTSSSSARRLEIEPMAVFPRKEGFVAFPLEVLAGRLDLAWATTVHKAQGSEYDSVLVVLPDAPVRPLTRELLYTAVTRARCSVVLCGKKAMIEAAIGKEMARSSGLLDAVDSRSAG